MKMIDKIEITIVKNGVRHILQPAIANSEYCADSVASMICEVVSMCGIDSDYAAKRIKEQARWEKE